MRMSSLLEPHRGISCLILDLDAVFTFKKCLCVLRILEEKLKCSRNADAQRFRTEGGTGQTQGLCETVSKVAEGTGVCAQVCQLPHAEDKARGVLLLCVYPGRLGNTISVCFGIGI